MYVYVHIPPPALSQMSKSMYSMILPRAEFVYTDSVF